MSEDSKMGLFGSKDKKAVTAQESTLKDVSKNDSPDPYCIDSDNEAYDTEALSIMDINDIIGVQTGTSESTLETEIAALSEIITDSGADSQIAERKQAVHKNSKENDAAMISEDSTLISVDETTNSNIKPDDKVDSKIDMKSETIIDLNIKSNTTTDQESPKKESDLKSNDESVTKINATLNLKGNTEVSVETITDSPETVAGKKENVDSKAIFEPEVVDHERDVKVSIQESVDNTTVLKGDDESLMASVAETVIDNQKNIFEPKSESESEVNIMSKSTKKSIHETLDDTSEAQSVDRNLTESNNASISKDCPSTSIEGAVKDNLNASETIDSKSTFEKIIIESSVHSKISIDILTNVGSTCKSLQLIGEAYISEDSQETDERSHAFITESKYDSSSKMEEHEPDRKVINIATKFQSIEDTAGYLIKSTEDESNDQIGYNTLQEQVKNSNLKDVETDSLEESLAYNSSLQVVETRNTDSELTANKKCEYDEKKEVIDDPTSQSVEITEKVIEIEMTNIDSKSEIEQSSKTVEDNIAELKTKAKDIVGEVLGLGYGQTEEEINEISLEEVKMLEELIQQPGHNPEDVKMKFEEVATNEDFTMKENVLKRSKIDTAEEEIHSEEEKLKNEIEISETDNYRDSSINVFDPSRIENKIQECENIKRFDESQTHSIVLQKSDLESSEAKSTRGLAIIQGESVREENLMPEREERSETMRGIEKSSEINDTQEDVGEIGMDLILKNGKSQSSPVTIELTNAITKEEQLSKTEESITYSSMANETQMKTEETEIVGSSEDKNIQAFGIQESEITMSKEVQAVRIGENVAGSVDVEEFQRSINETKIASILEDERLSLSSEAFHEKQLKSFEDKQIKKEEIIAIQAEDVTSNETITNIIQNPAVDSKEEIKLQSSGIDNNTEIEIISIEVSDKMAIEIQSDVSTSMKTLEVSIKDAEKQIEIISSATELELPENVNLTKECVINGRSMVADNKNAIESINEESVSEAMVPGKSVELQRSVFSTLELFDQEIVGEESQNTAPLLKELSMVGDIQTPVEVKPGIFELKLSEPEIQSQETQNEESISKDLIYSENVIPETYIVLPSSEVVETELTRAETDLKETQNLKRIKHLSISQEIHTDNQSLVSEQESVIEIEVFNVAKYSQLPEMTNHSPVDLEKIISDPKSTFSKENKSNYEGIAPSTTLTAKHITISDTKSIPKSEINLEGNASQNMNETAEPEIEEVIVETFLKKYENVSETIFQSESEQETITDLVEKDLENIETLQEDVSVSVLNEITEGTETEYHKQNEDSIHTNEISLILHQEESDVVPDVPESFVDKNPVEPSKHKIADLEEDNVEMNLSLNPQDKEKYFQEKIVDRLQVSEDNSPLDQMPETRKNIQETSDFEIEQICKTEVKEVKSNLLASEHSPLDVAEIYSDGSEDMNDETESNSDKRENLQNETENLLSPSKNLPPISAVIQQDLDQKLSGVPETISEETLPQKLNNDEAILKRESTVSVMDESTQSSDILIESEGKKYDIKVTKSNEIRTFEKLQEVPKNDKEDTTITLSQKDSNKTPSLSYDTDYITDVNSGATSNTNSVSPGDDNPIDVRVNGTAIDVFSVEKQSELLEQSEILAITEDQTLAGEDPVVENEPTQLEINETVIIKDNELKIESQLSGEPQKSLIDTVGMSESKNDSPVEALPESPDQAGNQDDLQGGNDIASLQNPEILELESAVKFLQESEEQGMDSPLAMSPKTVNSVEENVSERSSDLFSQEAEVCEDSSDLVVELQKIVPDPIAISEAEIISEAAKLESERRATLAEQKIKVSETGVTFPEADLNPGEIDSNFSVTEATISKDLLVDIGVSKLQKELEKSIKLSPKGSELIPRLLETVLTRSDKLPKVSILEERLKEPPKIEIPLPEISPRISDTPSTSKSSLLMQKDFRTESRTAYQKMLESPKSSERTELKIIDTPSRKDSEKHDFENVGSPRIILKIAKSAIADCGEPRSPKSPKIRSATNSPNPEDSPGQKLGKIKLKLSKGGHPSIISNENVEETSQRHTEGSSPSPIGMKIKLSKTGDASIIQSEKHEFSEEKEFKHKYEEKRIESPIGMKIKLSRTGDASIIQQESKDTISKHKDRSDVGQEIPKRTESPFGMKIKLSKSGDASIIQSEKQETLDRDKSEISHETPKRTDSPFGMKIKLSKTGDASIISSETPEDSTDFSLKSKEKLDTNQEAPKRTESPIGMKIKLSKSGGASIVQPEKPEFPEGFSLGSPKRTDSPLGMKIKLSKSGDALIIHSEVSEEYRETTGRHKDKSELVQDIPKRTDSPIGVKIKVTKTGEASIIPPPETSEDPKSAEKSETTQETPKRNESPIGVKIKLSRTGDATIIHPDTLNAPKESLSKTKERMESPKRTESPIGMKIKLSKTGDASIIQSELPEETQECVSQPKDKLENCQEISKKIESPIGMKFKLSRTGDALIVEPDRREKSTTKQKEKLLNILDASQKRKESESPIEMKIKLSRTGHPTIIATDKKEHLGDPSLKVKEISESVQNPAQKRREPESTVMEPPLKILKSGHSTIVQSNRSDLIIEAVQSHSKKSESSMESSPKRKEITISPIDSKKSRLEAKLSHMLPEVTIQPVMSNEQKQMIFDPKSNTISRQQMNVISQEISITQVTTSSKPMDRSMSDKLKDLLSKNTSGSPASSDCEIIEHRPELIIVNENSNSSQDVLIIEEVPAPVPEVKIPRKRGRPKRNPLPPGHLAQHLSQVPVPRDPLALDEAPRPVSAEHRENERPKRTCRNQKSYAPPKRGRGRGRGKRKLDKTDSPLGKRTRLDDDLTAIEKSTTSLLPVEPPILLDTPKKTSELFKALKHPSPDHRGIVPESRLEIRKDFSPELKPVAKAELKDSSSESRSEKTSEKSTPEKSVISRPASPEQKTPEKSIEDSKSSCQDAKTLGQDIPTTPEPQNWLTPSSKKQSETPGRTESISMVQVIDEETRMSAESGSRSQTPAKNISAPVTETIINEESQGSVLSTATTESEKVKVKNRRMEINFDPDEGPFTVDKIAEYEWPLDRKGETFMIQEQISQYLGVKSFKRKYPDLKRRMVEMEERNYLRENALVSEAMCDMGLTAVCSSEVLDVMCGDFRDQYEEYRKHMREKQAKEHSKKQKELTAAANAERNRIDLAEMAVQSALSWNVNLNKARRESRKCSLDLQTFTIHVPSKQQKVEEDRKVGSYPVALIPGQYTDYYREYTPAELRYYPLNTVLYGPMRPNERKFDSQSEGSQSDSDSDSSSDDSSSSSSEGTQDTEESQSTLDEVDMEIAVQKENNRKVKCKMCVKHLNKHGKTEVLIQCGTCNGNVHPSCIDLTLDMVPHIQAYAWQCTDCKTCAQCHDPADEDKMLFCDMCDRGYHIYCVGLRRVPQGRWHCQECAVCANCSSREPGGANSDRNSVALWQHEYKKGERNTRVYVSTLCVPCSKLWRKGRYCPHCSRCHSAPRLDLEANLVHCSACDKYLHLGCVETKGASIDRKNYLCEFCTPNRQQILKPLISRIFKI